MFHFTVKARDSGQCAKESCAERKKQLFKECFVPECKYSELRWYAPCAAMLSTVLIAHAFSHVNWPLCELPAIKKTCITRPSSSYSFLHLRNQSLAWVKVWIGTDKGVPANSGCPLQHPISDYSIHPTKALCCIQPLKKTQHLGRLCPPSSSYIQVRFRSLLFTISTKLVAFPVDCFAPRKP